MSERKPDAVETLKAHITPDPELHNKAPFTWGGFARVVSFLLLWIGVVAVYVLVRYVFR